MIEKQDDRSGDSLSQRIHRVYGRIPESERKVADLLLDAPGDLAYRNASEVAALAKVSNATVSRLFRRLEYSSYEQARRAAKQMRARGSPLYLITGEQSSLASGSALADHLKAEATVIERSLTDLDPRIVEEIARAIAKAGKVRIAGYRNSCFLAAYMVAAIAQFRPNVEMLTPPGQTLAEGIAGAGEGDLVLVIGLRRRPSFFADLVRALASTGADIVLLTDRSVREAPAHARWALGCAVDTAQVIDSYTGATTILRMVALATIRELGSQGPQHLERLEMLHEALGELE